MTSRLKFHAQFANKIMHIQLTMGEWSTIWGQVPAVARHRELHIGRHQDVEGWAGCRFGGWCGGRYRGAAMRRPAGGAIALCGNGLEDAIAYLWREYLIAQVYRNSEVPKSRP